MTYNSAKKDVTFVQSVPFEEVWSSFGEVSGGKIAKFIANPNTYLYRHPVPYSKPLHGALTEQEIALLKDVLSRLTTCPSWGMLTMTFPGRCGYQLYNAYKNLVKQGQIQELELPPKKKPQPPPNEDMRALSKEQENELCHFILERYEAHQRTTMKMVADKAHDLFYQPEALALKAAMIHFHKKGLNPLSADGDFSTEFLDYKAQAQDSYNQQPETFFKTYGFKEFRASYGWTVSFLKRNRFSIHHAHFRRRNSVRQSDVDNFLIQLHEAFQKYGEGLVFNMDETSICINGVPANTIAPVGEEEISIQINSSEKERFTAIGTCNKLRTFPLIILAKGTTVKCHEKFGRIPDTKVIHSESGWTDQNVMFEYLEWLSEQAHGQPCALILDSFRAHFTGPVKEFAETLHIELIKVPPNGTGEYQPLDRYVFGALKSMLRSMMQESVEPADRFQTVNEKLVRSWRRISPECLSKAWEIKGFEEFEASLEEIDESEQEVILE